MFEDMLRDVDRSKDYVAALNGNRGPSMMLHKGLVGACVDLRCNTYDDIWLLHELRDGTYRARMRRKLFFAFYKYAYVTWKALPGPSRKVVVESIIAKRFGNPKRVFDGNTLGPFFEEAALDAAEGDTVDTSGVVQQILAARGNTLSSANDRGQPTLADLFLKPIDENSQRFRGLTSWNPESRSVRRGIEDWEIRYFLFSQTHIRMRLRKTVAQIGRLHDRLGQFIDNTNQVNPSISLRRRKESAIHDHYVNELARWTHRDIANFVKNSLGENYPSNYCPLTIHSWDYDYTSRHFSVSRDDSHTFEGKERESEAGTILQRSFFADDCPHILPILAHEVGHQVLERCFTRNAGEWVINDNAKCGPLGKLLRDLRVIFDDYSHSKEIAPKLATEICADLLAAARFSTSFAFAWYIDFFLGDAYELANTTNLNLDVDASEILSSAHRPSRPPGVRFDAILRGKALVKFAELAFINSDGFEKCLLMSINEHLGLLARERFHSSKAERLWACVKSVEHCLENSIFVRKSVVFCKMFRWKGEEYPKSLANDHWYASRQTVSRQILESILPGSRLKNLHIAAASDIPWRCVWRRSHKRTKFGERYLPLVLRPKSKRSSRYIARSDYLYSVAIEDYVYRTMHPVTLRRALVSKTAYDSPEFEPNLLDIERHKTDWDSEYQFVFDDANFDASGGRLCFTKSFANQCERLSEWGVVIKGRNGTDGWKGLYRVRSGGDAPRFLALTYRPHEWFYPEGRLDKGLGYYQAEFRLMVPEQEKSLADVCNGEAKAESTRFICGRYDSFELREASGSTHWEPACEYPHMSRRRLLKRVTFSSSDDIFREPAALVFVSLEARGLRAFFLSWITEILSPSSDDFLPPDSFTFQGANFEFEVFLSDGWEDCLIFLNGSIEECFKFVRFLSDCPYVTRTETMFRLQNVIAESASAEKSWDMCLDIRTRAPDELVKQEMLSTLEDLCIDIWVEHIPGVFDFRIRLTGDLLPHYRELRQRLTQMRSIQRIETVVSEKYFRTSESIAKRK